MIRKDKLFAGFLAAIRDENPQHQGHVYIWGARTNLKDYDSFSRDSGFTTRLFTKRQDFVREIATASDVLVALILSDRLSQVIKRSIASVSEHFNPFYVLRIHSYVTYQESAKCVGVVFEYSPSAVADTPAALRVEEATRRVLDHASERWKASEAKPDGAEHATRALTDNV